MTALSNQEEIYDLVALDLDRVEEKLYSYAASSVQPVAAIGKHLIDAGGKRLRPALFLLVARSLGEVTDATIRLAAVMELIHNATLIHDDVIDDADTRRSKPSVNAQWGNSMTVLAGDWLYMQSFSLALKERSFEVLQRLIEITQKMVEGELLQLEMLGHIGVKKEQLLEIMRCKTAHLFAGCTSIPAILTGINEQSIQKLSSAGMNLGMAFQLVDDVLDLTATEELTGKPVANDLKNGKVTLPIYYALEQRPAENAEQVDRVMKEQEFRSVSSEKILALVQSADGVGRACALAEEFARAAISEMEVIPPSPYKDAIISIPEFILTRQT